MIYTRCDHDQTPLHYTYGVELTLLLHTFLTLAEAMSETFDDSPPASLYRDSGGPSQTATQPTEGYSVLASPLQARSPSRNSDGSKAADGTAAYLHNLYGSKVWELDEKDGYVPLASGANLTRLTSNQADNVHQFTTLDLLALTYRVLCEFTVDEQQRRQNEKEFVEAGVRKPDVKKMDKIEPMRLGFNLESLDEIGVQFSQRSWTVGHPWLEVTDSILDSPFMKDTKASISSLGEAHQQSANGRMKLSQICRAQWGDGKKFMAAACAQLEIAKDKRSSQVLNCGVCIFDPRDGTFKEDVRMAKAAWDRHVQEKGSDASQRRH